MKNEWFTLVVIFVIGLCAGVGERIVEGKHGIFLGVLLVIVLFLIACALKFVGVIFIIPCLST